VLHTTKIFFQAQKVVFHSWFDLHLFSGVTSNQISLESFVTVLFKG